jgi:hypothetical protein
MTLEAAPSVREHPCLTLARPTTIALAVSSTLVYQLSEVSKGNSRSVVQSFSASTLSKSLCKHSEKLKV